MLSAAHTGATGCPALPSATKGVEIKCRLQPWMCQHPEPICSAGDIAKEAFSAGKVIYLHYVLKYT